MSQDALNKLKISFINVGDGDAILIRESGEESFAMLVDTGRENVNPSPDSLRETCRDFLRDAGVKHLDALVVTHLHEDHAGGLCEVLKDVAIDSVYSGFFPNTDRYCADEPDGVKTVRGLIYCLNKWAKDVRELKSRGVRLISVEKTIKIELTNRLTAEIIVRDEASLKEQNAIYEYMLCGKALSEDQKIVASKLRNANSLRMRLYYGGRSVELAADCYGSLWENEAKHCDLFKVPHHGDAKSVTAKLAGALKPCDAVISCSSEYIPEKDRPSHDMAEILRKVGAHVWYVDSFSDENAEQVKRKSLDFLIFEDGRMLPSV